jgi:hypothetical protein
LRNPDDLLKQKPLFERYLYASTRQLSTYHFSSLFLWQDFFDFEFDCIDDSLCIFAYQPKACFLYLPPLATDLKDSVIDQCFAKMNKVNTKTARIENVEQSQLKVFGDRFKGYAKTQEYIYSREDLSELKGHDYKSQRHDIHHFQLHHQALFRPYEDKDLKDCLSLYERWACDRHDKHEDEIYRHMLKENRIVHELAMIYAGPLGLSGYVVEIEKKIFAYSFGYSLNSQTFCVLLEITEPQCTGLSAFIFNRVCADEQLKDYKLINTMDDFGLPFVAASKEAYHPQHKPISYTVTPT